MKKTLYLSLLAVLAITSCKKEDSTTSVEDAKLYVNTKSVMTLPGQGSSESWLYPNSDGSFTSAYGGNVKFTGIVYATGNYNDGDQVIGFETVLGDGQDGTISFTSSGPFFVKTQATFSAPANFHQKLNLYYTAYDNFIKEIKDPITGASIEPFYPLLSTYIPSNDLSSPGLITGQIVRSHASPSTFAIVAITFVPPGVGELPPI